MSNSDGYDRRRELHAFDATKAGVKGLVDAGITTIPAIFHHHPDSLGLPSSTCSEEITIPVINLLARRPEVIAQVKSAAETVGFFQVVEHGVPREILDGMLAAVRRFHESPVDTKRPYYTRDHLRRKVRFNSNFDLFQSPVANWRDTLFFQAFPDPPQPEESPAAVRGVMPVYADAIQRLASSVLELVSEALGLSPSHLKDLGCVEGLSVVSNYYPPCPQPHLTLGTSRHSDPAFLTVLLQDDMGGLQVFVDKGQQWVDVPPVPGALVVNIGDLLQLVSNGRLKSVEHRVACFCNADVRKETVYGPIDKLTTPMYRSITVAEFLSHYDSKGLDGRPTLHHFLLH